MDFGNEVTQFKKRINEKFLTSAKFAGVYEEIFINPSSTEMRSLESWNMYKEIKFIIYDDDIYIWGSSEPTYHMKIENHLRLDYKKSIRGTFNGKTNTVLVRKLDNSDMSMAASKPRETRDILEDKKKDLINLFGYYFEEYDF
jgi:hypothetical protein